MRLDLRTLLPLVRKALENGEIAQGSCTYSGPCAIGIAMTPEQRTYFDNRPETAIADLLDAGEITAPHSQHGDLAYLQQSTDKGALEEALIRLEKRYV